MTTYCWVRNQIVDYVHFPLIQNFNFFRVNNRLLFLLILFLTYPEALSSSIAPQLDAQQYLISKWSTYQKIWYSLCLVPSLLQPSTLCPVTGSVCSLPFMLCCFPSAVSSSFLYYPVGLMEHTSSTFLRKGNKFLKSLYCEKCLYAYFLLTF